MKKYSIIIMAALSLSIFSGCEKVLDVEPTTAIEFGEAITNYTTLERASLGAYSTFQDDDYYGLSYLIYQDLYADNLTFAGTFSTHREVANRVINTSNLQIANTWAAIYTAINRTNIVIREADRLTNITDEERSNIKAQMYFLRGLAYFDLVKVFGGVPLIQTPTTEITEIQYTTRSTESQTYDAIIADLTAAEAGLDVASANTLASKSAATALLARVYLQRGNNAQAEAKAMEVLESNEYALVDNFSTIFSNEGNSEVIFAIDFTLNDQNGLGSASDPTTTGQRFYLSAGAYNALSASTNDERFAATTVLVGSRRRLLKYNDIVNNSNNVPVIRLAEMYLIRAEARARQGMGTVVDLQVNSDINTIRERAGLLPVTSLANTEALTVILNQRRLEFIGEGLRFMDLKRYDLTGTLLGFAGENAYKDLWPIPLQQIEVNPALEQNQGY